MRYMLLLKCDPRPGAVPAEPMLHALAAYVGELARAGILLAAEGLEPSSTGARIRFAGGGHAVVDGPFPDPSTLVAGYVLLDVRSREEAIQWAVRCLVDVSLAEGGVADIEVRPVFELADAR